MKIDGFVSDVLSRYNKQAKALEKNESNKPKESSPKDGNKPKETDKVEISKDAKLLASVGERDTDRAKRVAAVKTAYENNTYKPNIDEVAKSILKEWKGE